MAQYPIFFELSWSILSTIGIANVFFGLLVGNITSFTYITAVPIVTSAASAVANGLCYYAFYLTSPPVANRAVASVFADILWLVQEAGLSFYNYIILNRVLRDIQWSIYAGMFWVIVIALTLIRVSIAITRIRLVLDEGEAESSSADLQKTVDDLHVAYFALLAVLECVSAYHLLSTFAKARSSALKRAAKTGVFTYLIRSAEVRLAFLAVIGTVRAVTHSLQTEAQGVTNLAGQIGRFAYTLQCLFPVILYIDLLSSKIVFTNKRRHTTTASNDPSRNQQACSSARQSVASRNDDAASFSSQTNVHGVRAAHSGHLRADPQNHVAAGGSFAAAAPDADIRAQCGGSKTGRHQKHGGIRC